MMKQRASSWKQRAATVATVLAAIVFGASMVYGGDDPDSPSDEGEEQSADGRVPSVAYFSVDGTGLVKMSDGGKTTKVGPNSSSIKTIATQGSSVYASTYSGVYRVEGGEVVKLPGIEDIWSIITMNAMVATAEGDVWGIERRDGVAHWDGESWGTTEIGELGEGVSTLRDIAVDDKGRVWLVARKALFVREDETWKEIDLKSGDHGPKLKLGRSLDSDGENVYLIDSPTLSSLEGEWVRVWRDGEWHRIAKLPGGAGYVTEIEAGPEGGYYLVMRPLTGGGDVKSIWLVTGGETKRIAKIKYAGAATNDVEVDERGRLWLATGSNGMFIVSPDGSTVHWEKGVPDEFDSEIERVETTGDGPTLPTPQK